MSYQIDIVDDLIRIEFYGTLDALDLILLNQSQDYKVAIQNKKKMLMDFTDINGSSLTAKDTQGLAMLGKLDSQRIKDLHLVIVIEQESAPAMQHICDKIFVDSSWQVDVVNSAAQGKQLLISEG
jgi:ethanolamine utilization cobalamin adenosyltransferase